MKIDKRNPAHWLYLLLFALSVAGALLWRPRARRRGRPLVLCYGHQLTGNLKALYDSLESDPDPPCEVAFLTMDPDYHAGLRRAGINSILARGPAAMAALARVRCIVSDHGLHVMAWLPRLTAIRFVDVWHGIPFKGWDADDFRTQHAYDEIWVSSRLLREFYLGRFGFRPEQVHVTGYGRSDRLVRGADDPAALRTAIGAPSAPTRLVLFAPTWHHDGGGGGRGPFDVPPAEFLAAVAGVCRVHHAICLVRTHLNTRSAELPDGPFLAVPQERFPDTEAVLLVSDVLVCDWSSIAFDWLLLDRPTVFLDVPAPFPKGFTLGPEYRYGAVADSLAALCDRLSAYLAEPDAYRREYAARAAAVRRAVYDDLADGRATARYVERLRRLL